MSLTPAVQLLLNQYEHPRQIVDHVAVPEANHPVAAAPEVLRPGGILLLLLGVLSAVKLDRQLARGAGEINDIRSSASAGARKRRPRLAPKDRPGVRAIARRTQFRRALPL